MNINGLPLEDDLHEIELQFALTEPRSMLLNKTIDESLFQSKEDPYREVAAFIMRWENSSIDDYIRDAADLQIDPLQVVIGGETFSISPGDAKSMKGHATIKKLHQILPPTSPGSPLVSEITVKSIDPDTAVAIYHRHEPGKNGINYDSYASLVLVRRGGAWKAAVFARRPLPTL